MKLVRQSEEEGITLGELLARNLTADELDELQNGLAKDLSRGYDRISEFMSDVEVLSLEDIMETHGQQEPALARASN